jgi:hypothetical protein
VATTPVTSVPATPMTATPTPMTMTPTPAAMVVPAPVVAMSPPDLLRLEVFDLLTRCHGWICILTRFIFTYWLRKQRSALRSRGKHGRAGCKSNSEFQKLSTFHGRPSYGRLCMMRKEFRRRDLNSG